MRLDRLTVIVATTLLATACSGHDAAAPVALPVAVEAAPTKAPVPLAAVAPETPTAKTAWFAFMEGVVKTVAMLLVSAPSAREVVLSGRVAAIERVQVDLARRLSTVAPRVAVQHLRGFARTAKQGAQGAALVADGLAGGPEDELVSTMGIRRASGTVLDHLILISPATARHRLGIRDA